MIGPILLVLGLVAAGILFSLPVTSVWYGIGFWAAGISITAVIGGLLVSAWEVL